MDGLQLLKSRGFLSVDVPLTKGKWTSIDIDDAPVILQHDWIALTVKLKYRTLIYAIRNIYEHGVRVDQFRMHRAIMGAAPEQDVDHKNRDGLCNRRYNLRFCNQSGNSSNKILPPGESGFRGVHRDKRKAAGTKSYYALVEKGMVKFYSKLYYATAEEAADEYDRMVVELHGEFAVTNKMLREIAAGKQAAS